MRIIRVSVAFLALLGCSSSADSAQPDPGADAGGTPPAAQAPRPLGCAEIFDCIGLCKDDPCVNACFTSGSQEGQTDALSLAQCNADHMCKDSTCLQASCQMQVDTCLAQGRPKGTPLGGGAATGTVPMELVGSWQVTNYGETDRFVFKADGTGYFQLGLTTAASCAITEETFWKGTIVVDATTIVISATSVTNETHECGQVMMTTSPPATRTFSYTYDAPTDVLTAVDSDCAAQYPDSPASQDLYCKNVYARE
ncbi:MAG TPA: hypothetical protein VIF62_27600 [Labilithrix sp.]|jgi:hypothetical protein